MLQIMLPELVAHLLKLMFIMLSDEVCIFVSIACRLHTSLHDVMIKKIVQCHQNVMAAMAFYFR
jgi:hypothetical protein